MLGHPAAEHSLIEAPVRLCLRCCMPVACNVGQLGGQRTSTSGRQHCQQCSISPCGRWTQSRGGTGSIILLFVFMPAVQHQWLPALPAVQRQLLWMVKYKQGCVSKNLSCPCHVLMCGFHAHVSSAASAPVEGRVQAGVCLQESSICRHLSFAGISFCGGWTTRRGEISRLVIAGTGSLHCCPVW